MIRNGRLVAFAGAMIWAAAAPAAEKTASRAVRYAAPPNWVAPPPDSSTAPMPPGAPLRIVYQDNQIRITPDGQEIYQATRMKLLTPEGLVAGNLGIAWSPSNETVTVHRLAIIRDGATIDVLKTQKFAIIQRENNLELSMLDGELTATVQTAGLQVGDEIEFAVTRLHRDDRASERPQGFSQFPIIGMRGAYRLRVLQPKALAVAYRASADVPQPAVRDLATESERQYLMADPASATIPDSAPPRYATTRVVQFSGYRDWAELSRVFGDLFTRAETLPATSEVKAEAARIAATTTDPARRAEAALRSVQDRIRYVYVGLDGGNYRPAAAEETWKRRFGDCKAKTVLLIAILREMGIAADPVLVASKGGDGIDAWLPTPALFDHVVVRATIGGKPVWLDGTRIGDRSIAALDPPPSRWGLPLSGASAALEPIAVAPPRFPTRIQVVELDASAGFDKPGKYHIQQTLRGDEIFAMRAQLAGVAAADADKLLAGYWRQQLSDVDPTRMTWRFDEDNRLLVLDMEGEGKVDWDGDATDGHTHYLFGAGFPPPSQMKRPKDQPQDAAWATEYPAFTCYATTVKVPPVTKGFHWSFSSKPMDRTIGGIDYWRISSFDGKTARMVKSRRVDVPEITATQAATANAAIAGFDNNKSYVWEVAGKDTDAAQPSPGMFGSFEDFAGAAPPCQSQASAAVRK